MDIVSKLSQEYENQRPIYKAFTKKIKNLITDIVKAKEFEVHSISSRTKDVRSLKGKLRDKEEKYKQLNEITDLSGIRVVVLMEDQVEEIEGLITDEFNIDPENSVNKGALLDPD